MRTEVIPQKTREVWEKYAKVISEAEAKVEKAKADLATASEDLVKKSKADDQVLKKLAAEVKEIEQKKAAMESCPRRHERPWPGTASCRRKPAPRTQKSELGGRPARPDGGRPRQRRLGESQLDHLHVQRQVLQELGLRGNRLQRRFVCVLLPAVRLFHLRCSPRYIDEDTYYFR
ncbi:unnamed protein product [Prorocentrum cordatum]|uniref:Uncharacterized protein n=1 Tax=Prorocentrum cordatum TaxID=2364126 RepID=A0ABN9U892_9DINO|nr:unnamed protein product [Polarella glacialis]